MRQTFTRVRSVTLATAQGASVGMEARPIDLQQLPASFSRAIPSMTIRPAFGIHPDSVFQAHENIRGCTVPAMMVGAGADRAHLVRLFGA